MAGLHKARQGRQAPEVPVADAARHSSTVHLAYLRYLTACRLSPPGSGLANMRRDMVPCLQLGRGRSSSSARARW